MDSILKVGKKYLWLCCVGERGGEGYILISDNMSNTNNYPCCDYIGQYVMRENILQLNYNAWELECKTKIYE